MSAMRGTASFCCALSRIFGNLFFFFNDTATTEIYTLSLHDALPISIPAPGGGGDSGLTWAEGTLWVGQYRDRKIDRKSTRLNSSHDQISYAVFCLKKKMNR